MRPWLPGIRTWVSAIVGVVQFPVALTGQPMPHLLPAGDLDRRGPAVGGEGRGGREPRCPSSPAEQPRGHHGPDPIDGGQAAVLRRPPRDSSRTRAVAAAGTSTTLSPRATSHCEMTAEAFGVL